MKLPPDEERMLCLIRQTLDMAEETRNEVVEVSRKLEEHTRILRKLGRKARNAVWRMKLI